MITGNIPTKNDLLESMLNDYSNCADSDGNSIDISKASMVYIDSDVYAKLLQGIYYFAKYVENQALPNLPNSSHETKLKWCSLYGIEVLSTDTDTDILNKIYDRIQSPPQGGSIADWRRWIRDTTLIHENSDGTEFTMTVGQYNVIEGIRYPGAIDVYVLQSSTDVPVYDSGATYTDGDIVYNSTTELIRTYASATYSEALCSAVLLTEINRICDINRPLGIWNNQYTTAVNQTQNIAITLNSLGLTSDLQTAIETFCDDIDIGGTLYVSDIEAICYDIGYRDISVSTPSNNVVLNGDKKLKLGTITLTEV